MTVFRHGVASGDPDVDRVVIWTRVTAGTGTPAELHWLLAADEQLSRPVADGTTIATADTDFTAQVDVDGLQPDTYYWYAFETSDERSPVGRTRTLPGAGVDHLRIAVVSCAKYNAGFFNGYARIADRDDLNFVLHLGDYIYEASQMPPASQTPGADIGRPFEPLHECRTLADYRLRYAQYRADRDTQRMHHAHPLLATLDDHELADGAWRGGADEHKPERDGPWSVRRAAAFRARAEWLPQRLPDPSEPDRVYRQVTLGGLADLFLIDTRSRRDQPAAGPALQDPARSQLGSAQREWLFAGLSESTTRWRLLANSSVMGQTWAPGITPEVRSGLRALKLINAEAGPDPDQWDGYPVERDQLLQRLTGRDAVLLSGDVHVGLANELRRSAADPASDPAAVEFVTASLTSQNLDDKMGWGYRAGSLAVEQQLLELLPQIRWCDLDSHGYMVVDVTPQRIDAEWWFVDGVLERSTGERLGKRFTVHFGSSRMQPS
jgi:phosphodiesterase/alkaline phosphatase D-like protein